MFTNLRSKMSLNIRSNITSLMVVIAFFAGCASQTFPLPPWDEELSRIMEPYRACKTYNTIDEYFKDDGLGLSSLADRLNEVCKKRKISRCAVAAAAHMEPFAYDDMSIFYAYRTCGMFVDGIEFQFDENGCVRKVVVVHLVV